jgi:hypothetical protein
MPRASGPAGELAFRGIRRLICDPRSVEGSYLLDAGGKPGIGDVEHLSNQEIGPEN